DADASWERPSLAGRAVENLRFIRQTMERAGGFTAVPGSGAVLMGITAVFAAAAAQKVTTQTGWLALWMCEALLAAAIGLLSMAGKSRRSQLSLLGTPARRFFWSLLPALAAGAVLTGFLVHRQDHGMLPGIWLLLYGAAAMAAGAASVRLVSLLGACFMAAGTAALFSPCAWGNLWLALGFGGINIFFGILVWRDYGE
ncbi:MAG: hypothetical protein V3T83_12500, partial [Acidobacteriota bacterium]